MVNTPTARDFVTRAMFRSGGPQGVEALLDGITYDVVDLGSDFVQIRTKAGDPVATLGFKDGHFVVAGRQ